MTAEQIKLFKDMLPFLIPLMVIQLALIVIALFDLFKREGKKNNTRLIWVPVIVLISVFGPIIYFIFGRKDKPIDSD
jgi:hypothetical protein